MSLFDDIAKYAENAPEAFTGYGPSKQYGKVTMTAEVMDWKNRQANGRPSLVPLEEWKQQHGPDLSKVSLQLTFEVDIQEFNPALDFNYSRSVVMEMNKKGKDGSVEKKTDWEETVRPSLLAVFGEKWSHVINGTYVEVIDEDSQQPAYQKKNPDGTKQVDDSGNPVMVKLSTIKFLRKFSSKEECLTARNETYKKQGDEVAAVDGEIPESVKEQVRGLISSVGKDSAKTMLASKPFGNYDPEVLIAASNLIP